MELDDKIKEQSTRQAPTSQINAVNPNILNSLKQNNTNSSNNCEDEDNDEDYRDKNKESMDLRQTVLDKLSPETANVIMENNEKMEEIIEGLKKKGISKEEGVSISKFKSIVAAKVRGM